MGTFHDHRGELHGITVFVDSPDARAWIGRVPPPTGEHWLTTATITWTQPLLNPIVPPDIPPDSLLDVEFDSQAAAAPDASSDLRFALVELSCPDDPANTHPSAELPVAVAHGPDGLNDLPDTPQKLIDLVAGDNNLGLTMLPQA